MFGTAGGAARHAGGKGSARQKRKLGRVKGPCKKYRFLGFWTRARGGRGPREALGGPSRGPRGPPGPKTTQSKKPRNLKELIKPCRKGRRPRLLTCEMLQALPSTGANSEDSKRTRPVATKTTEWLHPSKRYIYIYIYIYIFLSIYIYIYLYIPNSPLRLWTSRPPGANRK